MKPTYEELEAKCQLQKDKLEAINKLMGAIESAGDLAKDGIESLEQQLSESLRELRAAEATIHNLELNLTDMAAQLASADSKCAALATENTGIKAVCEDRRTFIMNGVQLGYIRVPTVETDPALETIRVAVSPQEPTPATDAFLAEVRAQGVEMAACALDDVNQFNYANMLDDLAQKLRQEANAARTGSRWRHH